MFKQFNIFRSGVETGAANAKQHYNFGNVMKDENDVARAAHHYLKAIT